MIEGQSPIDFESASEFWGLIENIAMIMVIRMKEKSTYGKERLTDYLDSLFIRLEIVREETLYKFVPNKFIYENIARIMRKGGKK